MPQTKILAEGNFTSEDLIVSVSASNRKINPTIENQLEDIWRKKKAAADAAGKICYNGLSYRLNQLTVDDGKINLDLAIFEYKVRDGLIAIPEYFNLNEDFYHNGCYTEGTIKTADGKYLMVQLSGKSMNLNKIEMIGGIMDADISTQMSGLGIFSSFLIELEEEAGIKASELTKISLKTIFLTVSTNICFYFEVETGLKSAEINQRFKATNSDPDIKNVITLDRDHYLSSLNNLQSDSKNLIAKLCSI